MTVDVSALDDVAWNLPVAIPGRPGWDLVIRVGWDEAEHGRWTREGSVAGMIIAYCVDVRFDADDGHGPRSLGDGQSLSFRDSSILRALGVSEPPDGVRRLMPLKRQVHMVGEAVVTATVQGASHGG